MARMFWVDRVVEDILKVRKTDIDSGEPLVVRDEKTASGHPHVGSMIGVMLHGTVTRVLQERNVNATFFYEINDIDPMDGMPVYLNEKTYREHMGKPLNKISAPEGDAPNLAEYFAQDFMKVIEESGFHPTFYRTSELYLTGRMNEAITTALTHGKEIREIYKKVSGSERGEDWLPLNVICESCGKVSTTKVIDFDGDTVGYVCREDVVEWAKGCKHEGRVSPYDGRATLPWKVEWPAKFKVMNVKVEGAGKDHTTKGGARDVANHISKEVFKYEPPFDIPYEYFLVGGKKMSSSKGNASSAREIGDLLPPHIFRLALVGREIARQANFDPEGDSVPLLFDKYDRFAQAYWEKVGDDDARTFEVIHREVGEEALLKPRFLPRFSQIAFIVQMPHLDIEKEVSVMKGSELTEGDKSELVLRADYAKRWLQKYAPEQFKFEIQSTLPLSAKNLSVLQKSALKEVLNFVELNVELDGKQLHEKLHEIKDSLSISPKELFSAIYLIFLNRESGPQAGWFLSTLDRDFLIERLKTVTEN